MLIFVYQKYEFKTTVYMSYLKVSTIYHFNNAAGLAIDTKSMVEET